VRPRCADYDEPATFRAALKKVHTLVSVSSDGRRETMRRHREIVIEAAPTQASTPSST